MGERVGEGVGGTESALAYVSLFWLDCGRHGELVAGWIL